VVFETEPCTRTISGFYAGSVTVRAGEVACFQGATVGGAVTVQPGGILRASDSTFNGAITSTGARRFRLCNSIVSGPVRVQSSTGPVQVGDEDDLCSGNDLRSALTVTGNTGGYVVMANAIGGATTVSNNTSSGPGEEFEVAYNRIRSSLSCTGNSPPPVGISNTTVGAKTGQCAAL
jgi:hypothetical protein